MSSLSGAELLGSWEFGMGGLMGEGRGKWGQSTSNLIRGRTVPVTAGGRQVSERGYKGKEWGWQWEQKGFGEKAKKEPRRVYM
jgi:hypothetical protein